MNGDIESLRIKRIETTQLFDLQHFQRFRIELFFLFFGIFFNYVFFVGNGFLTQGQVFARSTVALYALLLICYFRKNYTILPLAMLILLVGWVVFSSILGTDSIVLNYAYLFLLVFSIRSLRASLPSLIYSALLATLVVFAAHLFLILGDYIQVDPVTIAGRTRHYFGFSNPNKAGFVFFSAAVLTYWHLSLRAYRPLKALFFSAPFVTLIYFADSRTALASFALFVTLQFIPRLAQLRLLIPVLPVCFLLISAFISTQCETFLDELLSHRACMYSDFLRSVEPSAFFYGATFDEYLVDNSYLLALFSLGILGFCLALLSLFLNLKKINSRISMAFVISMFLYGLFEGVLIRPEFPLVIILYSLLYGAPVSAPLLKPVTTRQ